MKMLTKFESKSSRAKGMAFHPTRPWALVSLHSSTIQLWDYRMGTLIDRFEDHEGPVRSVDFHPTQPLFVSGGDDYAIKVWSLDSRQCLFTLNGHLDYIRTVFFHKELPWIISCSDDQTIRIWNWQNRSEIACLTGHNHYVMCAQFHPTEDMIVSASLDQTVRVWDISGLRKKHSAPGSQSYSEQSMGLPDFADGIVKFVLEGHDRGVNWATFHPTMPLIVSGGDDRQVKLWRYSATKAWEVDTCRGHTSNVSSVIFHPTQDLILSVGEDKTIRTWDLNKRVPVKQFKRDHDRFWLIAVHPHMDLFGTAHDTGAMVFKLDRERPAHAAHDNQLVFVNKEKQVQMFDYDRKTASLPLVSVASVGSQWSAFRSMSYNPSQRSVLLNTGEKYALVGLPREATGAVEPQSVSQGDGQFATFVARNRFVVFRNNALEIVDLNNKVTKTIPVDYNVKDICATGTSGTVLILKNSGVVLYDVQQGKAIADLSVNNVKYVSWSQDGQYVALLSKHTITIANRKLEMVTSMHETIRIKSATWDEAGILIYSTLNHVKYTLLNGDNGIIKTLDNTLYVTRAQGSHLYCLNRNGQVEILVIDPTEYRFKKALVNRNFGEVLRLIRNSNLVGQNIIAYLQKSGFPEIALQFVEDPQTRFELALEYGNLEVAVPEAQKLNKPAIWAKLGEAALEQGNSAIVELVYQQQRAFDKLSFFYLLTGEQEKLHKMERIAEQRGDVSSLLMNTVYNNSVGNRAAAFARYGSFPLAYATAKAQGDEELAQQLLQQAGVSEEDVVLPQMSNSSGVKQPVAKMGNWPMAPAEASYFEKALAGQVEDLHISEPAPAQGASQTLANSSNDVAFNDDEIVAEDDGWGMDEEIVVEDDDEPEFAEAESVETEISAWVRNSRVAAGFVAAGEFDTAAQFLNKQAGIVNFEPLRSRFTEVYEASKVHIPSTPESLAAITGYIRHGDCDSETPFVPGIDAIQAKMAEGFRLFKANQLQDAIKVFREVIYTVTVLAVTSKDDEEKAFEAVTIAREYILGLSIELERRALSQDDVKRNLELAAYFSRAQLLTQHRANALQVAMNQSFKHKNFVGASYFASEFLKIISSGPRADQAQKIKTKADSVGRDALEIDFDPYAEFDICGATHTPIYAGSPVVKDPLTGAAYHPSEKGKLDAIAGISTIGAPASGLRILV